MHHRNTDGTDGGDLAPPPLVSLGVHYHILFFFSVRHGVEKSHISMEKKLLSKPQSTIVPVYIFSSKRMHNRAHYEHGVFSFSVYDPTPLSRPGSVPYTDPADVPANTLSCPRCKYCSFGPGLATNKLFMIFCRKPKMHTTSDRRPSTPCTL